MKRNRFDYFKSCAFITLLCLSLFSCVHGPGADVESINSLVSIGQAPGPQESGNIPPAEKAGDRSDGPLSLTCQAAVRMVLENNVSFRIERLEPVISRAEEGIQRAIFDPLVSISAGMGEIRDDTAPDVTGTGERVDSELLEADFKVRGSLPIGMDWEIGIAEDFRSNSGREALESDSFDWNAVLTQSLLRGFGTRVNMVRLRQAELGTKISIYELRGAAEALVSQVEDSYWDCILAERSIEIYEKSLEIANREVEEVKERIRVGKVAETELAAAEAETASRREQLIEARGNLAKRRLALIRLLDPSGWNAGWNRQIDLEDKPEVPVVRLKSVEKHVETALECRADILQARLQISRGDLEVTRTRNGLLPELDFFAALGGSRYANSFSDGNDEDGDGVSYTVGLQFEWPLFNRDAGARYERASLSMKQARAALRNMEQLVQVDVRSAYVDVERAGERVKATAATRELREKTLRNEQEKFRVGRSTTFLVSQATRDLTASRIAEVDAVIEYRKALLDLHRLDGSLLVRRGITVEETR